MDFGNTLPGLVVLIYIVMEIIKRIFLKSDNSRKHIPIIAAIFGIVISIIIFFIQPDIIGCANILEAITMGGMSGFAATGCNQLYKKYTKYNTESLDDFDDVEYLEESDITEDCSDELNEEEVL